MIRIAICDDNKAFINYMTKAAEGTTLDIKSSQTRVCNPYNGKI